MTNLNWTEIASQHPFAFEAWCKHCSISNGILYTTRMRVEELTNSNFLNMAGWLESFFDQRGIYIKIDVWSRNEFNAHILSSNKAKEWHTISIVKTQISEHESMYRKTIFPTRTEAQIAAFSKAFELLQEQLLEADRMST